MSIEADLKTLLGPLVSGRVYPDVTPDTPTFPLIVYQQVGGRSFAFLDKTIPGRKHARIQINVWSKNRAQANAIARLAESAIVAGANAAESFGALSALYEEPFKLYGTRQDFGIFYLD